MNRLDAGQELRFEFGKNWTRYLRTVNSKRIDIAEKSVLSLLGKDSLYGLKFLDIGSGSGLFSLVARRNGAEVYSFDYDPFSVKCTEHLKDKYYPQDSKWSIERGSVLDENLMNKLSTFDIVYSWGVLHHTGQMWKAIDLAASAVKIGGLFCIAIYNDQGQTSKQWTRVKILYNKLPAALRGLILWPALVRLWGPTIVRDFLKGRPFRAWREYSVERGMSPIHDVIDWVGGYPFEVARPEEIFLFLKSKGFRLENMRTCGGGLGCNEFVFVREC